MIRKYVQNGLRDLTELGMDVPWENPEVVWTHPEGAYTIAKCDTQWDYGLETYFLAHCLGTKDYDAFSKAHMVYSIRDPLGIPHATILCVRANTYSPYGQCWDIGSFYTFDPEPSERDLRVLQVRGRTDDLAMPIFHAIAREWYVEHGGYINVDMALLVQAIERMGDKDVNYHFRYLLDESVNHFQWAHHNEKMRQLALWSGESL